jgi:hypothetical protein
MATIAGCVWCLWAAWNEDREDFSLHLRELRMDTMRTTVTLDTLNPDTATVIAHLSSNLSEDNLFQFDPSVQKQIPELTNMKKDPPQSKFRIDYQKPYIDDLSPIFGLLGLRLIFQNTGPPIFDRVKGLLEAEQPHDSNAVLSVIGDPRLYPFDRYLILYEVHGCAFLEYAKKTAYIDSSFQVQPRFPGMVVRELSKQELEGWDGTYGREFDLIAKQQKKNYPNIRRYSPEFWTGPGVAISVERPLFLRELTIVLGLAAISSMVFVYRLSEPSRYFLNSLGTFAALWGVRSILMTDAPKSPNIVDFAVLVFFIVQIVLVATRFLLSRGKAPKTPTAT